MKCTCFKLLVNGRRECFGSWRLVQSTAIQSQWLCSIAVLHVEPSHRPSVCSCQPADLTCYCPGPTQQSSASPPTPQPSDTQQNTSVAYAQCCALCKGSRCGSLAHCYVQCVWQHAVPQPQVQPQPQAQSEPQRQKQQQQQQQPLLHCNKSSTGLAAEGQATYTERPRGHRQQAQLS